MSKLKHNVLHLTDGIKFITQFFSLNKYELYSLGSLKLNIKQWLAAKSRYQSLSYLVVSST